jgi:hypothetical protein
MPVIKDHIALRARHKCLIMPVIEAQCASILVLHDHRHINQMSTVRAARGRQEDLTSVIIRKQRQVATAGLAFTRL